jgi:factor associated with neutral sphingomyelinase activation
MYQRNGKDVKPNCESEFFWKKKRQNRGRFNLLLLEYGEIFYESLSAFQCQVSHHDLFQSNAQKIKGRLHICSRSILFESNDIKQPLLKFPYKSIITDVQEYTSEEIDQYDDIASKLSTFRCTGFYEMKINENIGPYTYIDCKDHKNNSDCFIFELVHMDIIMFIRKIKQLRGNNDNYYCT